MWRMMPCAVRTVLILLAKLYSINPELGVVGYRTIMEVEKAPAGFRVEEVEIYFTVRLL